MRVGVWEDVRRLGGEARPWGRWAMARVDEVVGDWWGR